MGVIMQRLGLLNLHNTAIMGAVVGLVATVSSNARAEFERYTIDPAHVSIGFLVHHIGFADTLGMFREVEGSFMFDEDNPAVKDVVVTVNSSSVFTNHDARDGHARGGDFLDADNHPVIKFVGTSTEATGERTGTITGDLTMLGVTQPITFDLTWNKSGVYPFDPTGQGKPPYVIGISASSTVKRSDFGMTYGVEPGWVGDEIELIIEFEAIRDDDGAA